MQGGEEMNWKLLFTRAVHAVLKHPRDRHGDYGIRLLLHIPIGVIIGLASCIPFSQAGRVLCHLFIRYEENEDVHSKDEAWKDYAGAIAGVVLAFLGIAAAAIALVVKLC